MCDPYRLDDGENDGSFDEIPGRILSMGLVGADEEIGEIASARPKRIGDA